MIQSRLEEQLKQFYSIDFLADAPQYFQGQSEWIEKESRQLSFSTVPHTENDFFGDKLPREEELMREKFQEDIREKDDFENQFLVTHSQRRLDTGDQKSECNERETSNVKKRSNIETKGVQRCYKNFLTVMKKCIINQCFKQNGELHDQFICSFVEDKNRTNRREFQQLFQHEQMRKALAAMFYHGGLKRELQLSRINPENRRIFTKKISHLQRALIKRRLPNL